MEQAIAEDKAKAAKGNPVSDAAGSVPNDSEYGGSGANREAERDLERTAALEKQVMDLKMLNRGKDFLIGQLRQEQDGFFSQLLESSREVGQLETRRLRLKEPASESVATEKGVVEPRN